MEKHRDIENILNIMKPYLIILYLLVCVLNGALSDAFNDDGVKLWAHLLNFIQIGMLISAAFIYDLKRKDFIWFIVAYICMRIFAFDYTYNLARGLDLFYIGSTSVWDLILSKQHPAGLMFARFLFLSLGIGITIRYSNVKLKT